MCVCEMVWISTFFLGILRVSQVCRQDLGPSGKTYLFAVVSKSSRQKAENIFYVSLLLPTDSRCDSQHSQGCPAHPVFLRGLVLAECPKPEHTLNNHSGHRRVALCHNVTCLSVQMSIVSMRFPGVNNALRTFC